MLVTSAAVLASIYFVGRDTWELDNAGSILATQDQIAVCLKDDRHFDAMKLADDLLAQIKGRRLAMPIVLESISTVRALRRTAATTVDRLEVKEQEATALVLAGREPEALDQYLRLLDELEVPGSKDAGVNTSVRQRTPGDKVS